MAGKRYFILEETIAATQIESMMGRVVISKTLPLDKFAPFPAILPNEPSHNTNDIIPSILPCPSVSENRNDFIKSVQGNETHMSLSAIFGVDVTNSQEETATLDSQRIKRYTIVNPEQYFRALLENELYARDVRDILSSSGKSKGYFVTGFLTVTGATWKKDSSRTLKGTFTTSLPASQLAGVPIPYISDLGMRSVHERITQQGQDMNVLDEEIFAVSYSTVKLPYSFNGSLSKPISRRLVLGPPKRAKARHLALSQESDEEIEDDSDADENQRGGRDIVGEIAGSSDTLILWDDSQQFPSEVPGASFLLDC